MRSKLEKYPKHSMSQNTLGSPCIQRVLFGWRFLRGLFCLLFWSGLAALGVVGLCWFWLARSGVCGVRLGLVGEVCWVPGLAFVFFFDGFV